jgi:hypothetical protein
MHKHADEVVRSFFIERLDGSMDLGACICRGSTLFTTVTDNPIKVNVFCLLFASR